MHRGALRLWHAPQLWLSCLWRSCCQDSWGPSTIWNAWSPSRLLCCNQRGNLTIRWLHVGLYIRRNITECVTYLCLFIDASKVRLICTICNHADPQMFYLCCLRYNKQKRTNYETISKRISKRLKKQHNLIYKKYPAYLWYMWCSFLQKFGPSGLCDRILSSPRP